MSDRLATLKASIESLVAAQNIASAADARKLFLAFRDALTRGTIRAAEKKGEQKAGKK